MPWRLLLSPPLAGAANMALDEALMARARRTGDTVLRVYSWAAPVLSLGRNQRAAHAYDPRALVDAAVEVVRRPTGGRAILHHREITYSVTAPAPAGASPGLVYARINQLLINALHALGVPATVAAPAGRALRPGALPCFAEPAAGELVLGGRKLAGSAQWRDGGALLQHGSILVDDDQHRIAEFARQPGAPVAAPATLRAALGRAPSPAEVGAALRDAVRALEDPAADVMTLDDRTCTDAERLVARHRDHAWVWCR